jgi:CTD small phosphatase-like protein 2
LVLDLDETLMHYDATTDFFHIRPFAEEFIQKVSKKFEVIIFTAAEQEYADEILNEIDKHHCISHKLYRNHLTFMEGIPTKDLSKLGRSLDKIIIIDNIANNFALQPENGILIKSWYDDDYDEILHKVYELVESNFLSDNILDIATKFSEDLRKGILEYQDDIR